jgi:DNA-binding MarR family transcriptional regulator
MTGRLEELARAGLIERVPQPHDKRCVHAELTEDGLALTGEAVTAVVQAQRHVVNELGCDASRDLADQLRRLLAAVSQTAARGRRSQSRRDG